MEVIQTFAPAESREKGSHIGTDIMILLTGALTSHFFQNL
jgi:hypothetical protein